MDSGNAPGPSSTSSASTTSSYNHQASHGGGTTTPSSWCSFESVPPPPTPTEYHAGQKSPLPQPHASAVIGLGSSFAILSLDNHSGDGDEIDGEGVDIFYHEETHSKRSQAIAGKEEEVSNVFKLVDDLPPVPPPRSKLVFRRISNPEIKAQPNGTGGCSDEQVDGYGCCSSGGKSNKSIHRYFTLALPNSSGNKERLSTPSSNNHVLSDDDEPISTSSPRNNLAIIGSKDDIILSPSNSDSAEDAARLSSNPLCSSQVPEHTLSDISGPCSSSIVDKVPVSLIGSGVSVENGEEVHGTECDRQESEREACYNSPLPSPVQGPSGSKRAILSASTRNTSSSSSSSSLSDSSDELDPKVIYGLLYQSGKCGSLKDELPPPLEETEDEEAVPMTIDTCEDYWTRLHDIKINGCILEYMGIGKSVHDNGFAQSSVPLTPLNHYFEITILDPGESCYIAIGLAKKDYNMHRNPGWCRGSIAYHADDGKIFIGGGVGTPFGPRCSRLDILGCGIIFPEKYGDLPEGTRWPWETPEEEAGAVGGEKGSSSQATATSTKSRLPTRHRRKARAYSMDNFGVLSSESEDEIWWNKQSQVCEDKVKVFFMRNRKLLGMKEVRIPKGGFYPTIGMMSTNERVSVDLHPLSG